jgi:hypothetical protein
MDHFVQVSIVPSNPQTSRQTFKRGKKDQWQLASWNFKVKQHGLWWLSAWLRQLFPMWSKSERWYWALIASCRVKYNMQLHHSSQQSPMTDTRDSLQHNRHELHMHIADHLRWPHVIQSPWLLQIQYQFPHSSSPSRAFYLSTLATIWIPWDLTCGGLT